MKISKRPLSIYIESYLKISAGWSSNGGTFSSRCSTIASGPLSTCRPYGMACVRMPGRRRLAMAWISAACSAVHMEAQN